MRKLLFILLFSSLSGLQAQEVYSTVDLTANNFREFEIMSDSLDKYEIYFTGENHTFATFNTRFQFKFLKYLYATQNVRHLMVEQSPGLSYIVNKVVIDDELKHLNYFRDALFDPFYELVKEIRSFNDTIPLEERVRVHGIDVERFPSFSLHALEIMVDTLKVNGPGGEVFEQIRALGSSMYENASPAVFYQDNIDNFGFQFGEVNAFTSLESIIEGSYAEEDTIKKYLGKDSSTYFAIIKGLEVGKEWYATEKVGDVKSPIIRERFMANEFERVFLIDRDAKYYGQFGRCHTHKNENSGRCYDYYMNSIANRIGELDSMKSKVLVIPIFYNENKGFDRDVIESLQFDQKFISGTETYIIDLAYKDGDYSLSGYYNQLPFVIISNEDPDKENYYGYDFEIPIEQHHVGAYIGNHYIRGLSKLNSALVSNTSLPFETTWRTYAFSYDYFVNRGSGSNLSVLIYPEIQNGDRFRLRGYQISSGSSYSFIRGPFLLATCFSIGYGQFRLVENEAVVGGDNLIQQEGQDIVVYKNDIFTLDPSLKLRMSFPLLSLNMRAGYAFDVSGKYWKLNGKAKEFTKTSFSSPYIQLGASFNIKTY